MLRWPSIGTTTVFRCGDDGRTIREEDLDDSLRPPSDSEPLGDSTASWIASRLFDALSFVESFDRADELACDDGLVSVGDAVTGVAGTTLRSGGGDATDACSKIGDDGCEDTAAFGRGARGVGDRTREGGEKGLCGDGRTGESVLCVAGIGASTVRILVTFRGPQTSNFSREDACTL
jgi:hypothetical protein